MKDNLRGDDEGGKAKGLIDPGDRVRAAALKVAFAYPVETLVLAGQGAVACAGTESGRAILGALEIFSRAVAEAIEGDPAAIKRLEKMRRAGADTASDYLRVERLCAAYLDGDTSRRAARDQELVRDLALHVDPAFVRLHGDNHGFDRTDLAALAKDARDAGDLGARLIIRVDATEPRRTGESAEAHAKRIRGAMSDARSKKNVKAARR